MRIILVEWEILQLSSEGICQPFVEAAGVGAVEVVDDRLVWMQQSR